MTGHPAVLNAAVAANLGWDPLRYAKAEGVERLFADAVLEAAQKYRSEELRAMAEAIGVLVGNSVGEILAKTFST